ncbi:hypothetical protein INR49_016243 [Caranx melampygus]|nr:hypothetical protein INR49_016243 [Caranx melampygus]
MLYSTWHDSIYSFSQSAASAHKRLAAVSSNPLFNPLVPVLETLGPCETAGCLAAAGSSEQQQQQQQAASSEGEAN